MKFSVLVAIVPEDQEQDCVDAARDLGAGGITVLSGRGISNTAKSLSLDILKAIQKILMPDHSDSKGLVFTLPLEHLGGIDMSQVEKFEQHLKDSL